MPSGQDGPITRSKRQHHVPQALNGSREGLMKNIFLLALLLSILACICEMSLRVPSYRINPEKGRSGRRESADVPNAKLYLLFIRDPNHGIRPIVVHEFDRTDSERRTVTCCCGSASESAVLRQKLGDTVYSSESLQHDADGLKLYKS